MVQEGTYRAIPTAGSSKAACSLVDGHAGGGTPGLQPHLGHRFAGGFELELTLSGPAFSPGILHMEVDSVSDIRSH